MTEIVTDLSAVLDHARSIKHGMFRLETLQAYDVAYELEAYERFQRAGEVDLTPGPWQALVAGHVAAGRACRRVHVVTEPLTPYLQYELAAPYARSQAAGEQIRLLTVAPGSWPSGIPAYDFWVFDEEVWVMRYDHAGRFLQIEVDRSPRAVQEHQAAAEMAFTAAKPVTE
jgi:hypothetical protein